MDVSAIVSLRRNPPLRDFVLFETVTVLWLGTDLAVTTFVPHLSCRLLTTYLLPFVGLLGVTLVVRLNRSLATAGGDRRTAALGTLFVVGAAVTDLASTVIVSPDLSLEANPYVRILLDSGHSLQFVYLHTAATQAGYVALFCGMWLAFLRHAPVVIETIAAARPAGRLEFLKAATGGSHLTTRQWLLPLRPSELPLLYHCLWPLVISIVFGISLFRWYVALEWMDVVVADPVTRVAVVAAGLSITLVLYFALLGRAYRSRVGWKEMTNVQ